MRTRHLIRAGVILFAIASLLPAQSASKSAGINERPVSSAHAVAQHVLPPEERGDLMMARGQYVAAIKAYQQAPQNSAAVWNKMGMAWQHLFATDKAKTDYRRALRLKARYPEAINNLGTIYYAEKDYREAERLYRKALKLMPHSATVYNNLGAAYFAQGNYKKGAKAYQSAFAIDPSVFGNATFHGVSEVGSTQQLAVQDYCLAELFAQAGMADRAIEYLRKAMGEGFSDHKRLMKDHAFSSLRKTAAFAELMKEEKKH